MGISYIPGPEQLLAPVMEQLVGAVQKRRNPHREMEEMMQQAFAKNPALLQQFADMEKNAPGTAEALGLGRLANIIKFVPESEEQSLNKETKGLRKDATVAKLKASTVTDTFTAEDVEGFRKALLADPSLSVEMYKKRATGSTSLDTKEQKINIAGKEIILNEKTREAELVANLPPVEGVQMIEDVAKMLRGQLTPDMVERVAAYASSDVYKASFNALMQSGTAKINNDQQNRSLNQTDRGLGFQERRLKLEETEAGEGGVKDARANAKFRRTEAMQAFEKAGYVGDLDSWMGLLFDADVQKRAAGLLDGTIKLRSGAEGIEDQALLRAAQANRDNQTMRTMGNAAKISKQVQTGMAQVESATSDSQRKFSLRALNDQLEQRARMGGEQLKAEWNDPWYKGGEIKFTTPKGEVVPRERVDALLNDPDSNDIVQANDPNFLSEGAQKALDYVLKSKNPESQLAAIKMQDDSPGKTLSAQIENAYRRKKGRPRPDTATQSYMEDPDKPGIFYPIDTPRKGTK